MTKNIHFRWVCKSVVMLMLLGSASATQADQTCAREPVALVKTHGAGAEDIVTLPLGGGRARLFAREVCPDLWGCAADQYRLGSVDIGPETASQNTQLAWRPPNTNDFRPLGMSLVLGIRSGEAVLFLIDAVMPLKIWRLPIMGGEIVPTEQPWFEDRDGVLKGANDIQAVGETAYVTRYDPLGLLPWRSGSWPGVVAVRADGARILGPEGFRGANGIVDLGPGRDLLVASYWDRRLYFLKKDVNIPGEASPATAELEIHPDNLTLDGGRVLIAGQRYVGLAALNLAISSVPSPSAVFDVRVGELGPGAVPGLVWDGGWSDGRSVSVAVPIVDGLALGQIRAPNILRVHCRDNAVP